MCCWSGWSLIGAVVGKGLARWSSNPMDSIGTSKPPSGSSSRGICSKSKGSYRGVFLTCSAIASSCRFLHSLLFLMVSSGFWCHGTELTMFCISFSMDEQRTAPPRTRRTPDVLNEAGTTAIGARTPPPETGNPPILRVATGSPHLMPRFLLQGHDPLRI